MGKLVEKFESEVVPATSPTTNTNTFESQKSGQKKGFVKDKLSKDGRRVLRKVFEVINSTSILDENQAKLLCDAIVKKFA